MKDFSEIRDALSRYKFLQECILTNVNFVNHLADVDISFNYIYDVNGNFRTDMNRNQIVTLRLSLIQWFQMNGGLTSNQLLYPEKMDWGSSEVSIVRISSDSALLKEHVSLNIRLHHLEILWETNRRIDIIFSTMEIFEGPKLI
jgi:hypothetical protein